MDYTQCIKEIREFFFIHDDRQADDVLKVITGMMLNWLEGDEARWFASQLPPQLSINHLRPYMSAREVLTPDEGTTRLASRFHINNIQAGHLMHQVLNLLHRTTSSEQDWQRLCEDMPAHWNEMLEAA